MLEKLKKRKLDINVSLHPFDKVTTITFKRKKYFSKYELCLLNEESYSKHGPMSK